MRTLKDTTYDRAYTYGGLQPHAVTRAGDLAMGYDANGNMTTKEWTKYGVKMSMTWNSENRMTESVSQNIYSGAKTLTRYKYDHEGNRVVKSSNYGEVVTPSAEISYRNDSIVTKHIFVSGVRVASKVCDEKSSNTYYQSIDHLGSTNILTDDKGEFYEHIETFPDGNIWVKEYVDQSGVNAVFTCHEMDVETKFFYATSRYYDASLSVFISTDDRFDGLFTHKGLNVYSYCHHNPVRFVDPDGHEMRGGNENGNYQVGRVGTDYRVKYFKSKTIARGGKWKDKGTNVVGIRHSDALAKDGHQKADDLFILINNNDIKGFYRGTTEPGQATERGVAHLIPGDYSYYKSNPRPNNRTRRYGYYSPLRNLPVVRDYNQSGDINFPENIMTTTGTAIQFHWMGFHGNDFINKYSHGCQGIKGRYGKDGAGVVFFLNDGRNSETQGAFTHFMQNAGRSFNYHLFNSSSIDKNEFDSRSMVDSIGM